MRRWILKAGATNLDGLVLEDAPMPEPGEGEVRIRVHAVSLNYRDQLVLGGGFARLPDRDLVTLFHHFSRGKIEVNCCNPYHCNGRT